MHPKPFLLVIQTCPGARVFFLQNLRGTLQTPYIWYPFNMLLQVQINNIYQNSIQENRAWISLVGAVVRLDSVLSRWRVRRGLTSRPQSNLSFLIRFVSGFVTEHMLPGSELSYYKNCNSSDNAAQETAGTHGNRALCATAATGREGTSNCKFALEVSRDVYQVLQSINALISGYETLTIKTYFCQKNFK